MHDPSILAFSIKSPIKRNGYRGSLIDIWHEDPETDGTDDSCGWFMRHRHCDKDKFAKVVKEFDFNFDAEYGGWFDKDGYPRFTPGAITIGLFRSAAWIHFDRNRSKTDKYMRHNLADILNFAENPVDSIWDTIRHPHVSRGPERHFFDRDEKLQSLANVIYPYIARNTRPWWQHPQWHFWHWRIQVMPILHLKRWLFSRCEKCGTRFGWAESPTSTAWHGEGPKWFRGEKHLQHSRCCSGASGIQQEPQ